MKGIDLPHGKILFPTSHQLPTATSYSIGFDSSGHKQKPLLYKVSTIMEGLTQRQTRGSDRK